MSEKVKDTFYVFKEELERCEYCGKVLLKQDFMVKMEQEFVFNVE